MRMNLRWEVGMFKKIEQDVGEEKVYSVSGTPSQHTYGVSKTNENLTNGIKITLTSSGYIKQKDPNTLEFSPHLATLPFPLLQNKKFNLSLSHSLYFSRSTVPHQSPLTSSSIFPLSTPNLDSRYLASPIIIGLIRKRPKSSLRCFQPRRRKFSRRFQL